MTARRILKNRWTRFRERSFLILWKSEGESETGHQIFVSNSVNGKVQETEITQIGFGCLIEGKGKFPGPAFEVQHEELTRLLTAISLPVPTPLQDELTGLEKYLKVEGVLLYKDPAQTTAIINGDIYSPGQTIGGYEILEVHSDSIRVREKLSGKTGRVFLAEAQPKAPAKKIKPAQESAPRKIEDSFSQKLTAAREISGSLPSLPGTMDLQKIQKAALTFSQKNPQQPLAWQTLAAFDPAAIEKSPMAALYNFTFEKTKSGKVEVYASPKSDQFHLFYFMIDENGQVHTEKEKPATRQSPNLSAADMQKADKSSSSGFF